MIIVEDVYKRYRTDHGMGKWVLSGVNITIPPKVNVGLVGRNGAGKSTLLKLIGGVDQPNKGRVERQCRVSWPLGYSGGLPGALTGRQTAKFICRVHGDEAELPERINYIQGFADLGEAFDEPTKTYSPGMRSRLNFAMSLAFEFDVYLSDEVTAAGDASFKKKAKDAFNKLVNRSGLIMVSHAEGMLKEFCTAGIWLHEGNAQWFDKIDDALYAYKDSIGIGGVAPDELQQMLAGHVRSVNQSIWGWAANKLTEEVVSVDILVNGKAAMTIEAKDARPRLKELGVNRFGIGGFAAPYSELGLKPGDVVRVVHAGTQDDLTGSPIRIE